ncbi:hypothetical protein HU200_053540 [Digitaria exilis]|uniref:DUF8039 domain-containing protein n=1 Tax=Digitaria exilis TaxID=1010633 RepID=A0A835AP17_9POAL|nr:hypothetical protein HU200_053540 [Digitaria exilis]
MDDGRENLDEFMSHLIRGDNFELPPEQDLPEGEYDGSQYLNVTSDGDEAAHSNYEEEDVPETKAVAHAVAEVPVDGGVIHGIPIPPGYARVNVDRVLPGWEDLDLEIKGGDGEKVLGQALHSWICWQKKYIIFPRLTITKSSGQDTGIRSTPTADVTPPQQRSTDTSKSNSSAACSNGASTTSY